ncbi:MAG: 16S rRNA (guanine(527)-N(7))-methyltransferase RsmG [Bacteroidales bacterium]|nr:16S rRNA (guanine(527)-N(7))-methyltransferase RsmG [Bacteroidales bacterium]
MEHIIKYFCNLTDTQKEQFKQLGEIYPEWNEKINVISRKDIENLYVNHILHSLSIAKFLNFEDDTNVLDFGTGGGFPGIPLAIYYPNVQFHLVDRIGKKLRVVQDVVDRLSLKNVTVQHGDIKEVKGKYDFVVSRAVMTLDEMLPLVRKLIKKDMHNAMPNGVICLKGGDLTEELKKHKDVLVDNLDVYFDEPFFETKKIVYLPV